LRMIARGVFKMDDFQQIVKEVRRLELGEIP
jgi:hypothetical protein